MGEQVLVSPAIEIHIVFSGDGSRAFEMRFAPLPLDTSREDLDETLDRVLAAVERQRARYELVDEELLLEAQRDRIRSFEGQMISLEEYSKARWENSGRRGEWTVDNLSAAEKNARDGMNVSLGKDRHDAEARVRKITRLRERINGHGLDIGADRSPG